MKKLALEIIDYQNNDKFPDKLTTMIESIYKDIDNDRFVDNRDIITNTNYAITIQKLIKDRFNLNIIFDEKMSDYYYASILPFMSDYLLDTNIIKDIDGKQFSKNYYEMFNYITKLNKEREAYLLKIHNKKGYIDLKNARVGGYLAEVKHYIAINFIAIKQDGITPRELTAIILHEIGHAFSGLEVHHRLTTTNSTIMDILNNINNNKVDKAKYIFKREFTDKELEESSLGTKKEITDFYGKLAEVYIKEIHSQLVNIKYDETNYENLADSFSSRFGLYRELVSSLRKINAITGEVTSKSNISYEMIVFISIMQYLILLIFTNVVGLALSVYLIIFVVGSRNNHMTYDFPIDRYNRIKNSLINNLKNNNLDPRLIKDLLEQFSYIDKIIKDSNYFKGVLPTVADYIFSENRNNMYYIKLQQDIENSLNNMLFVKSAQLSVISS